MTTWQRRSYTVWGLLLGPIAFVYALGPWIERTWFPVVEPFVVTKTIQTAGGVYVSGWMDKRREDCTPIEGFAVAEPEIGLPAIVDLEFLERPGKQTLVTRSKGPQAWGPWFVAAPQDAVRVVARFRHRCHLFWVTKSEYPVFLRQPSNDVIR